MPLQNATRKHPLARSDRANEAHAHRRVKSNLDRAAGEAVEFALAEARAATDEAIHARRNLQAEVPTRTNWNGNARTY